MPLQDVKPWKSHWLGFQNCRKKNINEQISSDLEPDQLSYFSKNDGSFMYSSQKESGYTHDGIVGLFKKKISIQIPILASLNA